MPNSEVPAGKPLIFLVDPNFLSLNQLSETFNKAEVLAAEIAIISIT